jgi:hypothetical protein
MDSGNRPSLSNVTRLATAWCFLPDTPDTSKGHVSLAPQDEIRFLSSLTANQPEGSLKRLGKGLLSEHALVMQESSPQDGQKSVSISDRIGFGET